MGRLVQSALLALAVLGCGPSPLPVVVEPEPRPSLETEPETEPWRLDTVPLQLLDDYVREQGERVSGIATPWAEATARVLGHDARSVAETIGIVDDTPGRMPVILSSKAHGDGRWTYVTSDTARVHQITPVGGDAIAVLAAAGPPDAQVIDVFEAQWILGLRRATEPAVTLPLVTRIPHQVAGLWDVLTTSLDVHDGRLRVTVEIAHSGGGDPCDQRFVFFVRVEPGPQLLLDRVEHHEGACGATG